MVEIPLAGSTTVKLREHHKEDVLNQVKQGYPDSLPAYIPEGLRRANEVVVMAILNGAKVKLVKNRPDIFCKGCDRRKTCDFKD